MGTTPIGDDRALELYQTGKYKLDVSVMARHSTWLVIDTKKLGPREEYPISSEFARKLMHGELGQKTAGFQAA